MASFTFCPRLPIARLKCSSDTTTSILFWSSSRTTLRTSAGDKEEIAKFEKELQETYDKVTLGGLVKGEVAANSLNVASSAKVEGNLKTNALSIDLGAEVSGSITRIS